MNYIEFYYNRDKYKGEDSSDFLSHYGILGQKWGQRRWQNADGTFNAEGKERYFGTGKFKPVSKEEQGDKINRNKFAQEYLSRKNISNGHKMFDQMIKDDPEFKKLTDEHWEKEKKFRDDAVKKGSVNSFEHVKILNDYYDKMADLAEKKYGLNGNEKYDFAFHTQGISEEKIHNDSKFKDISKLPVNDTAEDIKAYQEYAKQRREEKIGSNPDKKAIKEGKKLEKELVKSMDKSWEEREKLQDKIINDPKYKEAFDNLTKSNNEKLAKEYSRLNEIFDDYEKNETENVAKGGIASWMLDGNTKMGELGRGAWLYLFEDLNQGYANAESLYTRYEKNIDKKEIDYLYDKLHNNKDLHKENIQYLKDNNKALSQVNDAQLLMLVRKNEENNPNNKTGAYWDLYNAADDSVQNGNKERDAYKEAKKVTQKLNKSCGNDDNGWDWLNKAIENLGMDDIDYKDMTQADWDKLNVEVNRLKSK